MATLKLHKASISFGKKEVLNEISFSLETGEILGIFGRNGCGKSTLLKMIFGTLKKGFIEITIDDKKFYPSKNISEKRIAYLPQHSFLPMNLKVRDVIPIYFSEEEKQDVIFYNPLIAKIAAQNIGALSHGQIRYLEVLLVSNLNHPYLLLDEPFSMIEPLYKIEIQNLLQKISSTKGIIITDHYYEDVLAITSKNIIINNGISHSINSKEDLYAWTYLRKN
ncbi:ABC transporter ATP-binding protein [Aequorivita sediminis]|uniref:ABC transporter ATP-binding protein n=1 Tax=Aequorivita sediminis TaxID=3073653 RepID=UPI0028A69157|nr:ABC transporter ATP-binding protein [Aequorivita sp. F6058]